VGFYEGRKWDISLIWKNGKFNLVFRCDHATVLCYKGVCKRDAERHGTWIQRTGRQWLKTVVNAGRRTVKACVQLFRGARTVENSTRKRREYIDGRKQILLPSEPGVTFTAWSICNEPGPLS